MAFTRRIFTKEFRLNAAKLVVDEHRPAVDVARELDINVARQHKVPTNRQPK